MIVTWWFLFILSLVRYTESECSSTSYYRNCWIRRFPGLHVDTEEAQRKGARLLQLYRGDSAQNCSRACCLTSNFSCNMAVFHYNTTEDSVNCFHLHCPTLQSCILYQRANVILYNVTEGMDPDLLIFGKYFDSNVQVLPHLDSLNNSDSSGTDKRQFNRPHVEPSSSTHPTIPATSPKTSTTTPASTFPISTPPPLSVYSTKDNQDTLPASALQRSTTLKRSSQLISTHIITNPSTDPTVVSTTKTSPAPTSTMQPSVSFANKQTSTEPQSAHTSSTTKTPSQLSSHHTSSSTPSSQVALLETTTTYTGSQTTFTALTTLLNSAISTTFSSGHTTPFSRNLQSTGEATTIPVPFTTTLQSSTRETTSMLVPVTTTPQSNTGETTSMPVPLTTTPRTKSMLGPLSSARQTSTGESTTIPVSPSSILQSSTGQTSTMPVLLPSSAQSTTADTTTIPVLQSSKAETLTTPAPLSSTAQNTTPETTPMSVPPSSAVQSTTAKTTTMLVLLSTDSQNNMGESTPGLLSSTLQRNTEASTPMPVPLASTVQSTTKDTTTRPVSLSSILQSSKSQTTAYTTLATSQPSSANPPLASTILIPVKTTIGYVTTTTEPQVKTSSFTSTSWSDNQPINIQSTESPLMEKRITPSSTTGLSQGYTTDISVTTIRPTTLNRLHSSATNSGLNTSPTTPTIVEDSQPHPNDTKGYISRNVTTGNSPQPVSDGGLTQVWHLAANTVLVALATCAALACGCCCSVLMAASWRGRRRRKGRYQTTLKGKKGSMRLIKYVFVRESS